ncbi:putative phage tail protein [Afifella sp. IM 167]|uniref:putative phage tail protein n=1 Tax=Afifella sp. IM 167 TaxID=2033586 RepID=UPI001CCC9977|nr:putative phage tail protein [Afifella sp. IM 167]MBZ8133216.1 hypothetical protein [Afifella sp. IM 167]
MSIWYVNDKVAQPFALPWGDRVVMVTCDGGPPDLDLDPADALSDPEVEALLPAGRALWPRGGAWGTPDGAAPPLDDVYSDLTRALLSPFRDLFARLWGLTRESRSASLVESLAEWERDFGLPESCITDEQSEADRRRHLRAKVASDGPITAEEFVCLADSLGYLVAIEEPEAFRCGESSVGVSLAGRRELTNGPLEQEWVVHVFDVPVTRFECGVSECGVDRLLDWVADEIECVLRRAAPAWTFPVFSYAPWPVAMTLVTEDGVPFVTENGEPLLAPVAAGD